MEKKLSAIIIAQMLIIVSLFAAITVADEIQWPTSWILYDEDDDENGLADYMDVKNSSYYIDDDYLFFRLECYGDIDFSQKVRYKWFIDISEPHDMMPKSNSSGNTIEGAEYLLFAEDSENPDKDGNVDIYLIESDNGLFPNGYDYITDPGNITDTSVANCSFNGRFIDLYIRRENISDPQHVYFTWATDKQTPNIDSTTGEYSDKFFDQNISKADISIIKSDSDDPVYYGGSFNYSLLVKNLGPHIANNINVTDEIPADLTFNSATPPSEGIPPNLFWNIPTLLVNESYEISINVTANSGFTGVITNTAFANNGTHDPIIINNQDTEETEVILKADLSIEKTASADTVVVGDELTYNITVTNNGPYASENVVVSDTLPADVTFLSAEPTPDESTGQIYNWNVGLLNSGESFVIEINVSADAIGTIINTAQAINDTEDPLLDNNEDSVETTVIGIADLSIEKTSEFTEPAHAGSSIIYYLNVTNHGPDVASNVNVVDILPDGVTFTDAMPMPDEVSGSEYRWIIGSMDVDESVIIRIDVTVNDSFYGTITNTATVEADSYDPNNDNNEDDEEIEVVTTSDLSIEKTSEFTEPAHAGSLIVYTLNVTNYGPDPATNVNVIDILPDGVTFINATPMPDEVSGSEYRWIIPSISAGESVYIKINVTVNDSFYGTITNTAYIEDDSYDPDDENDEDDDDIEVVTTSDLSIEKTSEFSEPLYAGDLVIYYLNVTNHGPDVALDVNVTDILPNEVTFVDSNLLPSGNNGQTYWWIISSIDVNESVIIRINVTINAGVSGTITNTATVEDDSYDPNDENNEDEEDVTVNEKTGGGGGGPPGGGGTPPPKNKIPTAKTDGPYYGLIGEEIQFNATESHDNDENGESIESYDWKFFDEDEWRNDLGATPTYTYNETGRYNISLRVTDDEGSTNIIMTFALIAKPNTPPSQPEVTGPQNGTTNVSYNFTVVSTDEDGDKIKYTIDWGDGNTTESDFLPSGVPFIAAHKWINSGEYIIKITADDNSTVTTDELTIAIIDPEPKPTKAEDNMWWLLLLLLLIIMLLIILLLYKRHRDKEKAQQPDKVAAKAKQTTKQ